MCTGRTAAACLTPADTSLNAAARRWGRLRRPLFSCTTSPSTPPASLLYQVCYRGYSRLAMDGPHSAIPDPNVWSGRALQEALVELVAGGLASMYPAFDWSWLLLAIMDISARAISLPDRSQRTIWVTSARMRREDRASISSYPLADLGKYPIGRFYDDEAKPVGRRLQWPSAPRSFDHGRERSRRCERVYWRARSPARCGAAVVWQPRSRV